LDFALAALFAVLAVEQWRSAHSTAPLWVAVVSYGVALTVLPQQALLVAIGLCVLTALALPKTKPAPQNHNVSGHPASAAKDRA